MNRGTLPPRSPYGIELKEMLPGSNLNYSDMAKFWGSTETDKSKMDQVLVSVCCLLSNERMWITAVSVCACFIDIATTK